MEKLTSELFREFMRLAFASEDFVGIVKQIHGSIGCEAPMCPIRAQVLFAC